MVVPVITSTRALKPTMRKIVGLIPNARGTALVVLTPLATKVLNLFPWLKKVLDLKPKIIGSGR